MSLFQHFFKEMLFLKKTIILMITFIITEKAHY